MTVLESDCAGQRVKVIHAGLTNRIHETHGVLPILEGLTRLIERPVQLAPADVSDAQVALVLRHVRMVANQPFLDCEGPVERLHRLRREAGLGLERA